MKRAERHHLKQDEFVHWLDGVVSWGVENQRNIVNATLVVVGAGLLLGGLYIYQGRRAETAQALLSEGLEQFHGVVRSGTGATPAPGVVTFESAEEKYRTALESFERVANQYGSLDAGRQARYYVGLCHANLSDFEAAEDTFAAIRAEGQRDLVHYLASRALAAIKAERGDAAGASEIYASLVDDAENPLPKDHLLFELAKVEERAGNVDLARQYYDRMLSEHPDSPLRGDATTRSEALEFAAGGANVSD